MPDQKTDSTKSYDLMPDALALARQAMAKGEVPVGAVIYHHGTKSVIATAHNLVEERGDCTAHAEMLAIAQAQKRLGSKSLKECDIWVSLEPCAMCAGALAHARIARIYYAAEDKKGGAIDHGPHIFNQPTTHHRPEIYGGLSSGEAANLLADFFKAKR